MNSRLSKKLRQIARRQVLALSNQMWQQVNRQFFAMLPRLPLKGRLKLAWLIIRAKNPDNNQPSPKVEKQTGSARGLRQPKPMPPKAESLTKEASSHKP